jgi:adenine-specific DNA-methyltransferase
MSERTYSSYKTSTSEEHRRQHGQFFTPEAVAAFMCQWVLDGHPNEVVDPAFGLGAFYKAARKLKADVRFRGFEVDALVLDHFRRHEREQTALTLTQGDYLLCWGAAAEAIVCNPPYLRFQHFKNREEVFRAFQQRLGLRLSGYTNCASAFLLKSLSELKAGGRLAYIMPLEFLNTGYGTLVKQQLLHRGRLKALLRLEAEQEVFPDAITSIGIVLVANDSKEEPVRFYSVRRLEDLSGVLASPPQRAIPCGELAAAEKWLRFFDDGPDIGPNPHLVRLADYGTFSRGIATGANEFFVLSPSKARSLRLPESVLAKCITRSSQVQGSVFTDEDMAALEAEDAEIFLLRVNGQMSGPVHDYLRYGEQQQYHLRYLTKTRRPWFKTEHRTPAPLLFGVFSRSKFKVVRNRSSALNLTCFHGFYPNLFGEPLVDKLFLYFQSQAARQILFQSMRRYGDGLDKFEPNDLNAALAPSAAWFAKISPEEVRTGLEACCRGEGLPVELERCFQELLKSADL